MRVQLRATTARIAEDDLIRAEAAPNVEGAYDPLQQVAPGPTNPPTAVGARLLGEVHLDLGD